MAFSLANYFNVLADEELSDVSKLITHVPKKATTSLPESGKKKKQAAANKKQEMKPDAVRMRAKPIFLGQERVMRRETKIQTQTQKQKPKLDAMQNHQQLQETVIERELSFKEYEKEILEKKKGLNSLNKPAEEKKVILDKELESMKLVRKKKSEDVNNFIKLPKSDKDQAKVRKLVDVSGFFKPLIRNETSFTAAANAVAEQVGDKMKSDLNIEDLSQFPALN